MARIDIDVKQAVADGLEYIEAINDYDFVGPWGFELNQNVAGIAISPQSSMPQAQLVLPTTGNGAPGGNTFISPGTPIVLDTSGLLSKEALTIDSPVVYAAADIVNSGGQAGTFCRFAVLLYLRPPPLIATRRNDFNSGVGFSEIAGGAGTTVLFGVPSLGRKLMHVCVYASVPGNVTAVNIYGDHHLVGATRAVLATGTPGADNWFEASLINQPGWRALRCEVVTSGATDLSGFYWLSDGV